MARGPLAGASGPGKFSKRTDLPSAYYGEGVETAAAGSEALMMNKSITKLSDTLAAMLPYDTTGEIAVLYQEALSRGN